MSDIDIRGGTFTQTHVGDNNQSLSIGAGASVGVATQNIYHVYQSGNTSEAPFDFDAYVKSVCERLRAEAAEHVQLEIEPIVTRVAGDAAPRADHRTLVDAAARERRMAVIGAAGSGKTSSLRYLAAMGGEDDEIRTYIELSRYRKPGTVSDLDALLILAGEVMNDWSAASKPPSIETLRRMLRDRPVLLILDGLNEVDASIRDDCLQGIRDLAFTFQNVRIILSSRPHGFEAPEGWSTFRLRELNDGQIEQFLRARADAATAEAVLERLRLDDNPLLRLPLFLTYAVRLVEHSAEGAARLMRSRATIVADYIAQLFTDRRFDAVDEGQMTRVLGCLALELQHVGQSLSIGDAIALVEKLGETKDVLATLATRGFLRVDARYVRFWHHTIQEYFYAQGQRRRFDLSIPFVWRFRVRRSLGNIANEDALTFMPAGATDDELKMLMPRAVRANLSLATRWADDLSTDERAPAAVSSYLRAVTRRLYGTALYSRFSSERRPVLAISTIVALGYAAATFHNFMIGSYEPDPRVTLLAHALWYVAVPLLALIALLFTLMYRGIRDAAMIAGLTRNVRGERLRQELDRIFEKIVRFPLSSHDLREIALAVIGKEERLDPLDALEQSRMPYLTIQLLAFNESPRAAAALQAIVEAGRGNLYSRGALLAMLHRALRDREEAERLRVLAAAIWKNRGDWLFRRVAGRCLSAIDPEFRMRYRLRAWPRAGVTALLFALITIVLQIGAYVAAATSGLYSMLFLPPVCGALMFAYGRHAKTGRVRGYHGLDSWRPVSYLIWGTLGGVLTLTFLPLITFLPHMRRMRMNGRGLDVKLVRQLVENDFREEIEQ